MHHEEYEFRRALRALRLEAPAAVMDDVDRLFQALMATVLTPTGERYQHLKRGTTYDVFAIGHANSAEEVDVVGFGNSRREKVLFDRDEVVVYRDVQSGSVSVRARDEFLDGRFALLPPRPGRAQVDPARMLSSASEAPPGSPGAPAAPQASTSSETAVGVRVRYAGPDSRKHDQWGRVVQWSDGYVQVRWDDPSVMGDMITRENALNLALS